LCFKVSGPVVLVELVQVCLGVCHVYDSTPSI
jgi:hypothetical protein